MAFDYGKKRTGIAVTDPLKIIANPLETVETDQLLDFVGKYIRQEAIECFCSRRSQEPG
jgi:putative Holliday junction resolvase